MGWFSRLFSRPGPPLHVAVDEGEGPVVVLVHGIASSSVTFENLIPLLTDRYRVIAVDILGFGQSTAPADAEFTIEEHVDALTATLRRLKLRRPFTLVGHSMGSLIVARYAAIHGSRVSKLVLVSPPVYQPPETFGDPADRAAMGLYLKAYDFLRSNKGFTIKNAAVLGKLLPIKDVLEVNEHNWTAFVRSLERAVESQTTVSDIAAVKAPVEVVYGTLDPFIMPAGLRIVEQMRHVRSHRVEANDHLVRLRLAKAVAAAIDGSDRTADHDSRRDGASGRLEAEQPVAPEGGR